MNGAWRSFLPYSSARKDGRRDLRRPRFAPPLLNPGSPLTLLLPHGKSLTLGSPIAVMGIVNATPDSFSDGGAFASAEEAAAHGERLVAEGAAILDVGGESTRPGAAAVNADEEMSRVVPVIAALHRPRRPADLRRHQQSARRRGRAQGGGVDRQRRLGVSARPRNRPRRRRERRGGGADAQSRRVDPELDIIADILAFLSRSIEIALKAGVAEERLIVDPGFGFGKTPAQNLQLIRRLRELATLGRPVLLGVSRKSTIGLVTGLKVPAERVAGSIAAGLMGVANGAAILRVHDVAPHVQALQVWRAIGES